MTRFKPRASGVESNRSVNCAKIARILFEFSFDMFLLHLMSLIVVLCLIQWTLITVWGPLYHLFTDLGCKT